MLWLWITFACLASLASCTVLDGLESEHDHYISVGTAAPSENSHLFSDKTTPTAWDITEITTYHPNLNTTSAAEALAVLGLIPTQIPFSEIRESLSSEYHPPPKWNARGMEHLYTIVTFFIHLIQPGTALPDGVHVGDSLEELVNEFRDKWNVLLEFYLGIAIVGAIGVVLAVILPIVGFFFCCCRCFGRCGATTDPFDKKRDPCKRATLGVLLGILLILITFGVICAFVSNANVDDGVNNFPSQLKNSAEDVITFMNTTRADYHHLLVTNYQELEAVLNQALNESGRVLVRELGRVSQALSVENLTSIASRLSEVRQDLESVASDTQILEQYASQLQAGLAKVRENLLLLLQQCSSVQACTDFQTQHNNDVDFLAVNIPFQELPNVGNMARNISKLISSGIESEVRKGQEELQKLTERANNAVARQIPSVTRHLRVKGIQLENVAGNLSQFTDQGIRLLQSPRVVGNVDTVQTYIDMYEPYRFYVGIGMSALVLFILLCLCFGLMFGCCCKRPTEYGEDECGTKATAASCLMAGVYVFYLASWLLFLLAAGHFVLGGISEKLTCEDPTSHNARAVNPIAGVLDRTVDLKKMFPEIFHGSNASFSSLMHRCHHNETLYKALDLFSIYDVASLKEHAASVSVGEIVSRISGGLNQVWDGNVVLLNERAQKQLRELAQSALVSMNFTNHSLLLENQLTVVNLTLLAQDLNGTAVIVRDFDSNAALRLSNTSKWLMSLQSSYVAPMAQLATKLRVTVQRLQDNVRFNHSSLQEAITSLLDQVQRAEVFLKTKGNEKLEQLANDFADEFANALGTYANRVEFYVTNKLGRCGPLSQAYNASSGALCQAVVKPFNGLWASVGWSLLLFLPCLALAVSLVKLYRKSDPYPGPLVEHEYMYDAYADRDNIPLALANVRDGGRRARHTTDPRAYDHASNFAYYDGDTANNSFANGNGAPQRSGFGGAVVAPSDRELKHPGRYQDMAPRAWDNNGPPRYTTSPSLATPTRASPSQVTVTTAPAGLPTAGSEYERPPPYYYPGPA